MDDLKWVSTDGDAPPPGGVVAHGKYAGALLKRMQKLHDDELHMLSIVATRSLMVVLGNAADLPWVDGVRYCAPHETARNLWLPTLCRPTLPGDLLQTHLAQRTGAQAILLWHDPACIVPLARPAQIHQGLLHWLTRELG
ncbi:hypothetical protein [Undibacterium sp. Ji49W]|uniref:bpX5 domain-containing protein n=1 Tax=Undibacterium sp. Ji49W TaxID=3413040 RepID=UPI003BF03E2A